MRIHTEAGKRRDADVCPLDQGVLAGTPYRAMRRLGGGSLSDVFEVRGQTGEVRALKLLKTKGMGPDSAFRLALAGRVLSSLCHSNLVNVYGSGITADGRPYLVMERLFGRSLRRRLDQESRVAPLLCCSLFLGLLDGLDAAHRAGIVHRDIKPSHVFLCGNGAVLGEERAVVLDFGIAKIHRETSSATTGAHVIGTPKYWSPEQILGGRVDARTDVYGAGLVLYEALCGRSPFDARTTEESMRAHLFERPPPLTQFVRIRPALSHVVERALRKEPDRRFPSAGAFAAALRDVLSAGEACMELRPASAWSWVA